MTARKRDIAPSRSHTQVTGTQVTGTPADQAARDLSAGPPGAVLRGAVPSDAASSDAATTATTLRDADPTGVVVTRATPTGAIPTGAPPIGTPPTGLTQTGLTQTGATANDATTTGITRTGTTPSATTPSGAPPSAATPTEVTASIGIDPAISGGFINGRFDLIIRGRIAAAAPIEEAALVLGDAIIARTQFGDTAQIAATSQPDGAPIFERAFEFGLPLSRDSAEASHHCAIVTRTSDEQIHAEAFCLAVDPAAAPTVRVLSGPVLPDPPPGDAGAADMLPSIVLYVERAAIDLDGMLTLHGWTVAMTPVVAVQVFVDDTRVAAAKCGGNREDVGGLYPGYPDSRHAGFTAIAALGVASPAASPGIAEHRARSVRVQAICLNGTCCDVVIPIERITAPDGTVRSSADFAARTEGMLVPGELNERGSEASTAAALSADLTENAAPVSPGSKVTPAGATPARPAHARPVPASARPVNATPASAEQLERWDPPADPGREIVIFCDGAALAGDNTLTVVGWALCAAGIGSITIYLNGVLLGEAETGLSRPDVSEKFASIPMAPSAGYRFERQLDGPSLPPGDHVVRLVVRNRLDDIREVEAALEEGRVESRPPPPLQRLPSLPAPADLPQEFRFELDSPRLVDGAVADPITGRLTIEGWVLARSGIARVEVHLDDQRLGNAHYGLARQDVGTALPDWPDALRSGYAFHCPPRALRDGRHTVRITAYAKNERQHVVRFHIEVSKTEQAGDLMHIRRRIGRVETDLVDGVLDELRCRPTFQLVLRQTATPDPSWVLATLDALRSQAYRSWSLTILAKAADAEALRTLVATWDPILALRIVVVAADEPGWDAPLAPGAGPRQLCGLLCPGDELGADALTEIALAAGLRPEADLIYADEVRISPASHEREPFFKPGWSPDLLLSTNYIGRPWFADATLLQSLAVTPRSLTVDGEYDLLLRATEHAGHIQHVPKLLAQRASEELDGADASMTALARSAARRARPAEILPGWGPGTWRTKNAATATGKVCIIIPTCAAKGHIKTCIATLRGGTGYRNLEIVGVDNIPESEPGWKAWLRQNADRVVDMPGPFNWSRFNNLAAAATDSEYLLFLNDDIEIVQDDWLNVLLEALQRPGVAIAGPQLLYPDGKVQHAGMFLATDGVGRHAFRFAARDEPGYFGLALTQRNVMAVTGACMLVRRETFDRLGRFDERHSVVNNDLDFCLRAHQAGMLTVFTPHATLTHHELASRESLQEAYDRRHFNVRWKTFFAAGDPFFSPRLSRHADDYQPDEEPVQAVFAGHPLFRAQEIERILVVKLDHIGDFVTALPPIRRLKQMFPHARISVLAGRASEALVSMEPSIAELIPFDFFHARSELGEREMTKGALEVLRGRLAPCRFDLAVDLRKHLSTRDVLKYTGARFLAGFDYMGQFPFLDIALEWDGDRTLHRKRGHVVDDLLALVQAIGSAADSDRRMIQPRPARAEVADLPPEVRSLFAKPVVAVHAGVGNTTRQWPEEHYTALINLLVERDQVNIIMVGGPDDAPVSGSIISNVLHPESVASMAGKTPLGALPHLLSRCALFIGNNSGPQHIAAAIGIPTIGIHSGVVDAIEWGPIGERAIALQRNMTCSPCYLANASDCPRNLACLQRLEPTLVHQTAQTLLARPLRHAADACDPFAGSGPAGVAASAWLASDPEGPSPRAAAEDAARAEPDASAPRMAAARRSARTTSRGGAPRMPVTA